MAKLLAIFAILCVVQGLNAFTSNFDSEKMVDAAVSMGMDPHYARMRVNEGMNYLNNMRPEQREALSQMFQQFQNFRPSEGFSLDRMRDFVRSPAAHNMAQQMMANFRWQ